MTSGHATSTGTARYASRFPQEAAAGFYRRAADLEVSTLGLGTYLGAVDEATDDAYAEAVVTAVCSGINLLDAAINYRNQRSERSIGVALEHLFRSGDFQRDEIVICTKAGFLTPGAVDPSTLTQADVAGGMHAMAPAFLADQIDRSRANLGLDRLDVFYLHNPETQLRFVARDIFESRIRSAFARLEALVAEGKISYYGTATWDGYRQKAGGLDLNRLVQLAIEEGGSAHHFRFIQLPFNLAMTEAASNGVLEDAALAGITVVASASLLQAKLVKGLPAEIAARFPGLETDAQRALQFTRSTPGITAALAGMSKAAHVRENGAISLVPPA